MDGDVSRQCRRSLLSSHHRFFQKVVALGEQATILIEGVDSLSICTKASTAQVSLGLETHESAVLVLSSKHLGDVLALKLEVRQSASDLHQLLFMSVVAVAALAQDVDLVLQAVDLPAQARLIFDHRAQLCNGFPLLLKAPQNLSGFSCLL